MFPHTSFYKFSLQIWSKKPTGSSCNIAGMCWFRCCILSLVYRIPDNAFLSCISYWWDYAYQFCIGNGNNWYVNYWILFLYNTHILFIFRYWMEDSSRYYLPNSFQFWPSTATCDRLLHTRMALVSNSDISSITCTYYLLLVTSRISKVGTRCRQARGSIENFKKSCKN